METWIKTYGMKYKNNTLNDIVLPGTINSSQYELINSKIDIRTSCLIDCINKNWILHQEYDIYTQLVKGVRFLNINIHYEKNEFYVGGNFCYCKLDSVLQDISKFNKDYGDIFILNIVHDNSINSIIKDDLCNILIDIYDKNIIYTKNFIRPLNTPIYEFIEKKVNMLIYMKGSDHIFYSIHNYSYNNYNYNYSIDKCVYHFQRKIDKLSLTNNKDLLINFNWNRNFSCINIFIGLVFFCGYRNFKEYSNNLNIKLNKFICKNKRNIKNINVISVNYINDNIIGNILDIN
tara:strand:+ start:1863 stop:2732 length:870 start_codon:yes stop_codon:yes gene_type:complete